MPRYLISTFCLLLALLSLACSDSLVGQVDGEGYGTSIARGPGFYIAWWKLLMELELEQTQSSGNCGGPTRPVEFGTEQQKVTTFTVQTQNKVR